jgi:hypothetical protein
VLIDDESTWPSEVTRFLDQNFSVLDFRYGAQAKARDDERRNAPSGILVDWTREQAIASWRADEAERQFELVLRSSCTLTSGYHCTRLTDTEISHIEKKGMQPPNRQILAARIEALVQAGSLFPEIASMLVQTNQANDSNRAGKIWFCFFPPARAGQRGIERFFRRWGGEALYNSHEDDPVSGQALRNIGTPCVVEADVPMGSLSKSYAPGSKMIKRYFFARGWKNLELDRHQGYAVTDISPTLIRRVHRFPDAEFMRLTGCDGWNPVLS